ncbi:hypothetical protein BKA63DRAFT_517001 [Paraphoma chrysanthemicola]|nr:hypothetical protein BKA63DRAFT_517001 [Paraphoma chrysanthemicola]
MPGILCVWANLPDNVLEWYEDEWIPDMREQLSPHTLHCEYIPNGFDGEPIGQLDSPWPLITVYEVADVRKATDACYDKRYHPPDEMLAGSLKNARFDTRTYREIQKWQNEDWDGDASHIASVTGMEFHVPSELQDEVLAYYRAVMAPIIARSPDTIRFRLFEVDNATVLEGTEHSTKDRKTLHSYFVFAEFATEDWPWDAVLELGEDKNWVAWFEGQKVVKWQNAHYLVKRLYTDEDKPVKPNKQQTGKSGPD